MMIAVLLLVLQAQATSSSTVAPTPWNVIEYRRPGDSPNPAALAVAERLVSALLPPSGFVTVMMPDIVAAMRYPTDPGPAATPAARKAYVRAVFVAHVTQQELSSAYAGADKIFRAGLARDYALMLSISDLEEAERFYSSKAGTRFTTASFGLRTSNAYQEAIGAAAPLLVAAKQRIARRVAAASFQQ